MYQAPWTGRLVAALLPLGFGVAMLMAAEPSRAQKPSPYPGADMALGERLIGEHRCSACHARRVGGDGSDIYDPAGKISTPAKLLAMVEACNTQLNLSLFPEEVSSIAAVLDRLHYRFK